MSKVEIKETIGCKKKLGVEVESERLDSQMGATLKKMKKEIQVPGFRRGKAPESLLLKRFGSVVREEAIKDMIPDVLQEIFNEQGIRPVGEPEISDFNSDEAGPITFTVTVEEIPKIDITGFEGLRVTKEVQEVADEDVDNYLERIREMKAERNEVDREAQAGDILVVNLQKLDSSGVPIIGEKMEEHIISLDGSGTPSQEFDEQVTGMKKGESKAVRFTYDETIDNPDIVGRTEAYDVEIVKVIENKMPELNDDFARSFGDYADFDDLREKARDSLANQYELSAERKLEHDLIEEFVKQKPFDVPNSMVERVIRSEFENTKKTYGDRPFDEEAYRSRIRPDAVRAVQTFLIADAVKQEKGIDVTQEEVSESLNEIADISGNSVQEVRRNLIKEGRFESFKNDVTQKKVYDWIREVAEINVETVKRKSMESNIITP